VRTGHDLIVLPTESSFNAWRLVECLKSVCEFVRLALMANSFLRRPSRSRSQRLMVDAGLLSHTLSQHRGTAAAQESPGTITLLDTRHQT